MTEVKKMLHQIENLQNKLEKETWLNLRILRNYVIYKCEEKYQTGHNDKCKAIGRTSYNCKTNHLSNVCRRKWKQVSKINKTENLEAKKSVNWMMSQIQHKKFLRFRCLAIMKIIYQINQSVALKRNMWQKQKYINQ